MLQPAPGNKPVSIPLSKVLSYNCYNNGVEVYKEGREKGYFFSVNDSGAVELFGLCLGFLLTPEDDVTPKGGSKVKTPKHTSNGLTTSQELSASTLNSTDAVSLLEKLELLRKEVHLLVAHAGYRIGASGDLEGNGDPEKLDRPRVQNCLTQMSAILESFKKFRSECDQSSLLRLQELLGKAGVIVSDETTLHIDAFADTHVDELTLTEKKEIRAILSGDLQIEEKEPNTIPPIIDVRGVAPCTFCGEPISSKAKFCSNCGKSTEN